MSRVSHQQKTMTEKELDLLREHNLELIEEYADNHGYKVNTTIKESVRNNQGFCPCRIERNKDTICPCKPERENGDCICNLFNK